MLYTDNDRLNYLVMPIVETKNFIVINQIVYDKKTLVQLASRNFEAGWAGVARFNKLIGMTCVTSVQISNFNRDTDYLCHLYGQIENNNIPSSVASVIDTTDQNIEWTIVGESLIKFNIKNKTFERSNISGSNYFTSGQFIYQDEEFLYYVGVANSADSYRYLRPVTINKITKAATFGSNIDGGANMGVRANILHTEGNVVYVATGCHGNSKYFAATCANGSQSWGGISGVPGNFSNTTSLPTILPSTYDRQHGWIYTLNTANSLAAFKIDGKTMHDIQTESLIASDKIDQSKIVDILELEDEYNDTLRASYFTPRYAYDGTSVHASKYYNYMHHECMLMGHDQEFLLVLCYNHHCVSQSLATKHYRKMCLYRRNDPENDPLNLTLVDYFDLTMQELSSGYHYWWTKTNDTQLIMAASTSIWFFDINDSGKFTINSMDVLGMSCVGVDEYGRIYTTNTSDTNVEMFNTNVAESIMLSYIDIKDPWIKYSGEPLYKEVKVSTTNMFGRPVSTNFELRLLGPAVFQDSNSKTLRSKTSAIGEKNVRIKFTGVGRVQIARKIIYDDELAIKD